MKNVQPGGPWEATLRCRDCRTVFTAEGDDIFAFQSKSYSGPTGDDVTVTVGFAVTCPGCQRGIELYHWDSGFWNHLGEWRILPGIPDSVYHDARLRRMRPEPAQWSTPS